MQLRPSSHVVSRSWDSSVSMVTTLWARLRLPAVARDRLFSTGVKTAERESDESSSSSTEVKHDWSNTSTSPYAVMERYLNTGTNLHLSS